MLVPIQSREMIEMRQLAIVAHELRNPLAAAWCALRLLAKSRPCAPEIQQALPHIERQLGYIARIVDDLVDVASVTSGKLSLHKERVDLSELLRAAIDSCRQRLDAGTHQFNASIPMGCLSVNADPLRLTQVFANLLDNAVKYSEPCGRIGVAVERSHDVAVVTVEDNGVGIRADVLPTIFDLFVQGGTPMIGSSRGLGVGLAVAKQVVEEHGGRIEARSAGIGLGSRFTVRIPLAKL
jgi:signal transduction histidine kinase